MILNNTLTKIFAVAAIGLTLAGCESNADKMRKPMVAENAITQSMNVCQPGAVNPDGYADRLRNILMDTRTADMETLQRNHITVCLDQRLSQQHLGWFDNRMEGVYYNDGKNGGVLTIWDNGQGPSFWSKDASDWGSALIHDFAYQVTKGRINPGDKHWFGYEYSYTTSCGQNCTTTNYDVDWTRERKFDKDTIHNNQDIVQHPPLRTFAPAEKAVPQF
ncbi:MAG TPA: hypothetical protein VL625_07480 [Patescibacteria group bacterium]|nr:hypothetical protein [Patescibacteria group bacterium]